MNMEGNPMNTVWTEIKTTCGHIAPWIALVGLTMFVLNQQQALVTEHLEVLKKRMEAIEVSVRDMERVLSTHGLVVPPFRAEEPTDD
jgi:hypothetical protein